MKKEEFVKGITYLGMAFNKEYNQQTIEMWYSYFEEIDYDIFKKAIKIAVERLSFPPAIKELQDLCKEVEKEKYMMLVNKLDSIGYFKSSNEKVKAMNWIDRDIIPYWFMNDMMEVEDKLLLTGSKQKEIEFKSAEESDTISDEELEELNRLFDEVKK